MINNLGVKEDTEIILFERGSFEFYNRKKKHKLYFLGKRTGLREYGIVKPNFKGSFTNDLPIDEDLYRLRKKEALARFEKKHKEEVKPKDNRFVKGFKRLLEILRAEQKLKEYSIKLEQNPTFLADLLANVPREPIMSEFGDNSIINLQSREVLTQKES
jgi:hypothetical protein